MLVDRESEKNKWIDALHELHRIIRRNKLSNRNVSKILSNFLLQFCAKILIIQPLRAYILMTTMHLSALRHHNNIHCCCVIDETRLLIGCDDALLCCDLDVHSYHRLTNSKRILQLTYSPSEQLVVALAGKQRQIKVFGVGVDLWDLKIFMEFCYLCSWFLFVLSTTIILIGSKFRRQRMQLPLPWRPQHRQLIFASQSRRLYFSLK